MEGKNVWANLGGGAALKPQSIASGGTANGYTIVKPGRIARRIGFILLAGSLTGTTVLTVKVQYDPGSGFVDLLNAAGTAITFTAAKTIAAALLDSTAISATQQGYLLGSIDLERAKDGDYRLAVTTNTGATIIVAAAYVLFNPRRAPIADISVVDDLLGKQPGPDLALA